jgi:quinol monooxygenase YgiN
MTIRHVVMWELHDPASVGRFREQLLSCAQLVPGQLGFEVGIRQDGLTATCHICLIATYRDLAALQAYQEHPHHQQVSVELAGLRRARQVLDYEVPDAA